MGQGPNQNYREPYDTTRSDARDNDPVTTMRESSSYSGSGNGDEVRATETIRAEIDRTRAEMDRTVDALQEKLDPQVVIHRTFDSIRENAGDVTSKALDLIKQNPVPAALIVIGLVWLIAKPGSKASSFMSHKSRTSHQQLHARSPIGSRFGRTESGSDVENTNSGSLSSMPSRISMGREGQSGCGGS
jgi:hypothetical protein